MSTFCCLQRAGEVAAGQGDVDGVGAVAVDDGGDLAVTTDASRRALAELVALLGFDTDLGHGDSSGARCVHAGVGDVQVVPARSTHQRPPRR